MNAPLRRARGASIIISSYNYGRYLRETIDSALNQTYADTEVIVVDDGSTDNSADIITKYNGRIISILKTNGGQASALNVGASVSRGAVLFFVDSDDILLPSAVEQAVECFSEPAVVKVHWPLRVVDADGRDMGRLIPDPVLPEGDLRQSVVEGGPYGYTWPDTSGNAWARRFIEAVFPIPEPEYRTCPDLYLSALAPLHGSIRRIAEPQVLYRDHGHNSSVRDPFMKRVHDGLSRERHCFQTLATECGKIGISVDPETWRRNSWWHQIHAATEEILRLVPEGQAFALIDGDQWGVGHDLAGRRPLSFIENNPQFWAEPHNDAMAMREVERLRAAGVSRIVFAWPHLWWLDHYAGLSHYLYSKFACLCETDAVVVFDLRP
jgi:hypothetical protein